MMADQQTYDDFNFTVVRLMIMVRKNANFDNGDENENTLDFVPGGPTPSDWVACWVLERVVLKSRKS